MCSTLRSPRLSYTTERKMPNPRKSRSPIKPLRLRRIRTPDRTVFEIIPSTFSPSKKTPDLDDTSECGDTTPKASSASGTVESPKSALNLKPAKFWTYVEVSPECEEEQPAPSSSTPARKTELDRLVGDLLGPDAYIPPKRSCVARQGGMIGWDALADELSPTKKPKKSPARPKKKTPSRTTSQTENMANNLQTTPKRSTTKKRRMKKKNEPGELLDERVQVAASGMEKFCVEDEAAPESRAESVASVELGYPAMNDAGALNAKTFNLCSSVQNETQVVQKSPDSVENMSPEFEMVFEDASAPEAETTPKAVPADSWIAAQNEDQMSLNKTSETPQLEPPSADQQLDGVADFEDSDEFSPEFGCSASSRVLSDQLAALQVQAPIPESLTVPAPVAEIVHLEKEKLEEEHQLQIPASPAPENEPEEKAVNASVIFPTEVSKENVSPFAAPFPPSRSSVKKKARHSASSGESRRTSRESSPFEPLPRHTVGIKLVPTARTHMPNVIQISRATFDTIRPRLPSLWSAAASGDDSD